MRAWLIDIIDGLALVAFLSALYLALPYLTAMIHGGI